MISPLPDAPALNTTSCECIWAAASNGTRPIAKTLVSIIVELEQ
jgi:hypothetical protein